MVMKNKLYKHHKSKAHYLLRSASLFTLVLSAFALAIILPAYLSTQNNENITVKAESENANSSSEVASYN